MNTEVLPKVRKVYGTFMQRFSITYGFALIDGRQVDLHPTVQVEELTLSIEKIHPNQYDVLLVPDNADNVSHKTSEPAKWVAEQVGIIYQEVDDIDYDDVVENQGLVSAI